MYKQWLYFTCKWSTLGLDGDEFETWQHLSQELNKLCEDCVEGHICESCKNTGLKLTGVETMLLRNIELSLEANRSGSVN